MKANKYASKKAESTSNQFPANINFSEIIQKTLSTEFKPLFEQLCFLSKKLQATQEQLHSLHAIMMQDNNGILIAKLDNIEKSLNSKIETIKTASNKPESDETPSNATALQLMQKYFSGTLSNEEGFNKFIASADFSTPETLEKAFAEFNRNASALLCARRSNKAYLAAIWQVKQDMATGNNKNKAIPKTTPVKNFEFWSKKLGCSVEDIKAFADILKP